MDDHCNERRGLIAYEIAFPISSIHQIPRVRSAQVLEGVLLPLVLAGDVITHCRLELFDINICAVNAIAGAKDPVDVVDEELERVGYLVVW